MATTYLQSDFAGTGSATGAKATYSFWVKPAVKDDRSTFVSGRADGGNYMKFRFANDALHFYGNHSSSNNLNVETNRLFRDATAWLHIVLQVDTTESSSSDRVKFYVNNEQQTSFSNSTYPSQNDPLYLTSEDDVQVGAFNDTEHFDGQMSQFYCIDGTLYAPSTFAETDSTSGFWIAKTSVSVTYGSKGYFLKFASGSPYADSSGNGNDFTLGAGTLTSLKDTPDNNFATLNPLDNYYFGGTFTNANNTTESPSSTYAMCTSTLGMSSGKYYAEAKLQAGYPQLKFGITSKPAWTSNQTMAFSGSTCYSGSDGTLVLDGVTTTGWGSTFSVGDIIGIAVDCDNNKIYFSVNGTWQNSANPSAGTGSETIVAPSTTDTGHYYFSWSDNKADGGSTMQYNFGQGYFGTTAVSTAGTNASNNGTFEYDVPTGFGALCTKQINGD